MYEKLKQAIEQAEGDVDFAPFGEGIEDRWIEAAEARLNVSLPASYKWWLKNYNGGEVYGEEIYSIYGIDFDKVVGGDIVYINELNRKMYPDFGDKLSICETDDEIFYFDLSKGLVGDEYPVYELYSNSLYADSFAEFLTKRILG